MNTTEVGNHVPLSLVDEALVLADMAYQLRLIDEPRLYAANSLACRLCGYRMTGFDAIHGHRLDPDVDRRNISTYSDGTMVPDHWIMHHTPLDLVMRAAEQKGTTDG